ncbi:MULTISPECIES: hypothetical protein [Streptomyces]|uniref:Uncharacterized protein n=2 Tax=Streptomyces TaxID=1883 RepID=A0ABV9JAN7_9ACTN
MRLSSATPEAYAAEPASRLRQIASTAHAEIKGRRGLLAGIVAMDGDLPTELVSQLIAAQQWHQVWRCVSDRVDDVSVLVGTVYEQINEAPDGFLVLVARDLRAQFSQELHAGPKSPRPRSGVDQEFAYQWQAAQARYLAETCFLDDVPTVGSLGEDAS